MSTRITFIHTVPALAEQLDELLAHAAASTSIRHIVAPRLLERTLEAGHLEQATINQLRKLVDEGAGDADLVMVTCSTLGPAVDQLAPTRPTLHRVDAAMASLAVTVGGRLGVLTTLESALAPTSELLLRTASQKGCIIELTQVLCDGAFEAFSRGDHDRHDEQVREGLSDLALSVDAIVVAQGSTARVADSMCHKLGVPVLSSLRPAAAWITDQLR